MLILLVASQTGWAADDRVFYGLIALFLVVQVFWLIYIFRRQRAEKYVDLLQRTFEHD